jgi:hypothetical protein
MRKTDMDNSELMRRMKSDLLLDSEELSQLIVRAPYSYKIYQIPKRSGGKRQIAQPARETKYLQYWLIKNIFQKLPIHDAVTSYRRGCGIKANALRHANNSYLVKLDFNDFLAAFTLKHY